MSDYVMAINKDMDSFKPIVHTIDTSNPLELMRANEIVSALKKTLVAYPNLPALSAPQMGYSERIFCLKFANGDIRAFIDPLVISPDNEEWMDKHGFVDVESPIGFSDEKYFVFRFDEVHAAYQTPTGKSEMNLFKDFAGGVFQQMYDLLDGIPLRNIDEYENGYAIEMPKGYERATKESRDGFVSMYMERYYSKKEEDRKRSEADPSIKEAKKAADYAKAVLSGKIKVSPLSESEKAEVKANEEKALKAEKDAPKEPK